MCKTARALYVKQLKNIIRRENGAAQPTILPYDALVNPSPTQYLADIERALDAYSKSPADPEPALWRAMRYSLLLPGKRLRPLLTLLACEACGGNPTEALPAACAIEMVHCFSLIHDDLPAMDDDDLRRGQPTNHKVFGEAQAILAGDALLAHAFATITHMQSAETVRECTRELAHATGPSGMCLGQSLDMGREKPTTLDELAFLHCHKTGALILCAVRMGGIVAGANNTKMTALTRYGEALGLAFQITDDLLDATGDKDAAGKHVGKDKDAGKVTYPLLIGVDESKKRAKASIDEAVAAMAIFRAEAEPLREIALALADRRK